MKQDPIPLVYYLQQLLPQRFLTACAHYLATIRRPVWFKNALIRIFTHYYPISWEEAESVDLSAYPTFQAFFARALRAGQRTIAPGPTLVAPCDGVISACGRMNGTQLIQAKGQAFSLRRLIGEESAALKEGIFATFYLAPSDYHRVHMPFEGKLKKLRFIPGKLYSVQPLTQSLIPQLYAKNERLVLFFETTCGQPMIVVLVGAMIVGSLWTSWTGPLRHKKIWEQTYEQTASGGPLFQKGDEIGRFMIGSTVILIGPSSATWHDMLCEGARLHYGEAIGHMPMPDHPQNVLHKLDQEHLIEPSVSDQNP